MASNRFFYNNVPIVEDSFIDIISNKKRFQKIPNDWYVIVSDIENSTQAFDEGKYKDMNNISASTVAIAVNVASENHVEIPFIYGGDGSTVVVPKKILKLILGELITLRENAQQNFDLNLRVGYMSVEDIEEADKELLVSKFLVAEGYTQAVFLGDGLYFAEEKIKRDKRYQTRIEVERRTLNLEGLQCRWDEILPPKGKPEALTLIVQSQREKMDTKTYLQVLHDIEEVYGNFNQRHPITPKNTLRFLGFGTLADASRIKFGYLNLFYVTWQFLASFFHSINIAFGLNLELFRHDDYTDELVTATDTLKIDGNLKTIVAGTYKQRQKLLEKLKSREKRGQILFGHYVSLSTTLTCYIHKRNQQYVNLIDGTNGGYVQAAKELKAKIKEKQNHE